MKALLVHSGFEVIGGAEKVALHIATYLVNEGWDVTILSLRPPDFEEINQITEFSFPGNTIHTIKAECSDLFNGKLAFGVLQLAFLHRSAKKLAKHFDLCFSTDNEINFGKAGIQYIHHPYWPKRRLLHKYHVISVRNILDRYPPLEAVYRLIAHVIAGNFSGFSRNRTLVNSRFIQDVVKSIYNIESTVVYPGFLSDKDIYFRDGERDNNQLVAISRMTPDKNIPELVQAFSRLASQKPSVKLVIAGFAPNPGYLESVKNYIDQSKLPVVLETNVTREEIVHLLRGSRFFISTKKYEHFGISLLEAAANGCVPLVHKSGGAVEIVPYPELNFDNFDDLVSKIEHLTENPELVTALRTNLQEHIQMFSLDNFNKGLHQAITSFN